MYAISGSGNRMLMPSPAIWARVGQVTDPYAAYLVYDSFTGTNGTSLDAHTPEKGGPWVETIGAWTIQSNKASHPDAGAGGSNYATVDASEADVTVQATIVCGTAPYPGLAIRFDGVSSLLEIHLSPTDDMIYFLTNNAGSRSLLASAAFVHDSSTAYAFKVVTNGNSVKVYVDDVLYIDTTTALCQTETKHGPWLWNALLQYTATWDNFTVA